MHITSISREILNACAQYAANPAICEGSDSLTYGEFSCAIREWAAFFGGFSNVHRIGFLLQNSASYLCALYGAIEARAVPFLIDNSLAENEVHAIAAEVGIDCIVVSTTTGVSFGQFLADRDGLSLWRLDCSESRPVLHPDTAICRFTSGTGGLPKCLEFSHQAVLSAGHTWARSNGLDQNDVTVCLAGFFNGLAFNTSLAASFLSGSRLVLHSGWSNPSSVLRTAKRHNATRLVGFPVFYQHLAGSNINKEQISPLITHFYSAASPLSEDTRSKLRSKFDISIINYYGIAEVGPVTFEPRSMEAHGNGVPLIDCKMRVVDGHLEVRTPYIATRYLNRPGELEERITGDGFFRTSDLAEIVDGRLYLAGRSDSVLDVGGKKFDAGEVENAIRKIRGVTEAYVFGSSQAGRGMQTRAAVAGSSALNDASIRQSLRTVLAPFKIPHRIVVLDFLPRNGAGKLDAAQIRSYFTKGEALDG
ncbi:AMP-binding protein [Agrobacterium vitis]|uniref:AMP-binding protein n=1 Tax=Agrobacterium vitis TaxID=373 RepID=A0A6L6VJ19_AGRVI|nr:class I adenylate-forming enzyme family protein [Agrobacterium vitis]MUZ75833.1 AMP-binding protein [Agrobacterium vitis]MVA22745.1 AMP-binding protein [Agrobacterium vitis]